VIGQETVEDFYELGVDASPAEAWDTFRANENKVKFKPARSWMLIAASPAANRGASG
jgi:hypothetical protein